MAGEESRHGGKTRKSNQGRHEYAQAQRTFRSARCSIRTTRRRLGNFGNPGRMCQLFNPSSRFARKMSRRLRDKLRGRRKVNNGTPDQRPCVSRTNPVASMRFESLLVRFTQSKPVPPNRPPGYEHSLNSGRFLRLANIHAEKFVLSPVRTMNDFGLASRAE